MRDAPGRGDGLIGAMASWAYSSGMSWRSRSLETREVEVVERVEVLRVIWGAPIVPIVGEKRTFFGDVEDVEDVELWLRREEVLLTEEERFGRVGRVADGMEENIVAED